MEAAKPRELSCFVDLHKLITEIAGVPYLPARDIWERLVFEKFFSTIPDRTIPIDTYRTNHKEKISFIFSLKRQFPRKPAQIPDVFPDIHVALFPDDGSNPASSAIIDLLRRFLPSDAGIRILKHPDCVKKKLCQRALFEPWNTARKTPSCSENAPVSLSVNVAQESKTEASRRRKRVLDQCRARFKPFRKDKRAHYMKCVTYAVDTGSLPRQCDAKRELGISPSTLKAFRKDAKRLLRFDPPKQNP